MSIQKTFEAHVDQRWIMDDPKDSLFVMTSGLAGETGEVCDILKKHVRDRKLDFRHLREELGDALFYLVRIGQQFGLSLDEIMVANMDKLANQPQKGYQAAQLGPRIVAGVA